MAAPPLCDRVDVKVKGAGRSSTTLCAPALFIAGVGKCGTNSLAEHLSRHPQLIGMSHELPWDPLETPPQRMVRYRHVLPNSSKSWLVKHPKYSFAQVGPLARRLREAYPSARVALTLCDPAKLTWRRFAYAVSQSLTLHGGGAGEPSTFRAFVAALAELNTSLGRLFDGVMPVGADGAQCVQSGATSALLDRLSARGFKLLYSSSWLSTGEAGRKGCLREWAMVNGYATTVDGWSRAGFGVNRSLGVVFMEGWERDGPEYVASLLRLLGLPREAYPWGRVDFASAVYKNSLSAALAAAVAADPDAQRAAHGAWSPRGGRWDCEQHCGALRRLLRMNPPWCTGGRSAACRGARRVASAGGGGGAEEAGGGATTGEAAEGGDTEVAGSGG